VLEAKLSQIHFELRRTFVESKVYQNLFKVLGWVLIHGSLLELLCLFILQLENTPVVLKDVLFHYAFRD
jgi:hypothetical protein